MTSLEVEHRRPRRATDVAVVPGTEGALLAAPGGQVVQVDGRAASLWQLFDGEVSLGELADDVVAVFDGAVREAVLADLTSLVDELARHGVVDGDDLGGAVTAGGAGAAGGTGTGTGGSGGHLPAPESCCGNRLGEEPWRPTVGCRVGGRTIGVRAQHDLVDAAVRTALGPLVVEGDGVPPNLSLVLRLPPDGGAPVRLELHSQLQPVLRSASAAAVRHALEVELAALGDLEPDRLWLAGVPVAGPAGVALLPAWYRPSLPMLADELRSRGWALGPSRVAVDAVPGEVEVPALPHGAPAAAASRPFDQLADWEHDWPAALPPGRHRLAVAGLLRPEHAALADPAAPLEVVGRFLHHSRPSLCLDRDRPFQAVVDDLLALRSSVDLVGPPPDDVVGWLTRHLG